MPCLIVLGLHSSGDGHRRSRWERERGDCRRFELGRVPIGRETTIGGNGWLAEDVPPNSLVTQGGVRLRISPNAATALDDALAR